VQIRIFLLTREQLLEGDFFFFLECLSPTTY